MTGNEKGRGGGRETDGARESSCAAREWFVRHRTSRGELADPKGDEHATLTGTVDHLNFTRIVANVPRTGSTAPRHTTGSPSSDRNHFSGSVDARGAKKGRSLAREEQLVEAEQEEKRSPWSQPAETWTKADPAAELEV